jgi:pyruvate dehydrogenase E2 component (dihydrolipoyllysine-residue acetyltransferase)
MSDVVMPRLSDSMEEGSIVRWLKSDGDEVARGEELVEIETDKATITYEADSAGVLQIIASEGETLPVGEVIARLNGASAAEPPGESEALGVGRWEEAEEAEPEGQEEPERPEPEAPTPKAERPTPSTDGDRIKASPIARRMAQERGLDLGSLTGTGPGGRIVKADIEAAVGPTPKAQRPTPPVPQTGKGDVTTQALSKTQQLIARRMAESKATVPDFALQMEIDMEAAVAMRAQLKEVSEVVPSFNDMVVKAAALALREFPRANGSYKDGQFELHSRVNIGVAVAAQDALIVPTIFDADRKSLGEIARVARELAEKVRAGSVTPPELSGGTFTVSNLGMYGVTNFRAVINPPQAAILAVGAIEQRPAVHEREIQPRHRMAVTLACDHRILYGADAAQFLARIRELLEQPLAMAL